MTRKASGEQPEGDGQSENDPPTAASITDKRAPSAILRLDLHTHPREASWWKAPCRDLAIEIVSRVRIKKLDGIAITEHHDVEFGFGLQEIIAEEFGSEAPLIIPGWEIFEGDDEIVELFLPGGRVFRFMPHPYHPEHIDDLPLPIHGIEIANSMHDRDFDAARAAAVAVERDLLPLRNSDAHFMSGIGWYHNELSLKSLEEAAAKRHARFWHPKA